MKYFGGLLTIFFVFSLLAAGNDASAEMTTNEDGLQQFLFKREFSLLNDKLGTLQKKYESDFKRWTPLFGQIDG